MPTLNQYSEPKPIRRGKKRISTRPALNECPQKKGTVVKIFTRTPKKPNSAIRKLSRLRLSNGLRVLSYIPGEGHNLQEYANVLIRGGRVKDLPGVKYHSIRGARGYDFQPLAGRKTSRSKYGVKAEKKILA